MLVEEDSVLSLTDDDLIASAMPRSRDGRIITSNYKEASVTWTDCPDSYRADRHAARRPSTLVPTGRSLAPTHSLTEQSSGTSGSTDSLSHDRILYGMQTDQARMEG